ncbi:MAG: nucleotidyltransferase domain-containing protein [Actinomycetota bacterium]
MHKIFSTPERLKIIKYVIFKEGPLSVNAVADDLNLSKGLVSKYLELLLQEKITSRSKGKYLITDSAITKAIKIFLNISEIEVELFKKFKFVKSVGLYGSCAKGENTENSDIDIWLLVDDVEDGKVASLSSAISKKIKNAQSIFLTEKKLEKIKKDDELFYHSLSFGSIIIYGVKDAI